MQNCAPLWKVVGKQLAYQEIKSPQKIARITKICLGCSPGRCYLVGMGRMRIKQKRKQERMYLIRPPAPTEPVVVSPMMDQILSGPAPISGMQYCGITPLLNAALDAAIKTFVGARVVEHLPVGDKDVALLWMIRYAWGHWRDYAISRNDPYFSRVKENEEAAPADILHAMLFGDHECWFCGKMAERDDRYLPDFCWHRHCLLIAYAQDAVLFGGQEEIDWGSNVLNGYNFPIPQPPGTVQ